MFTVAIDGFETLYGNQTAIYMFQTITEVEDEDLNSVKLVRLQMFVVGSSKAVALLRRLTDVFYACLLSASNETNYTDNHFASCFVL